MNALKILENTFDKELNKWKKEWKILFGNALNAEMDLADLNNKEAARRNLGLYEEFMTKDEMKSGSKINTIHHSAIIQDDNARFINNVQEKFWNKKLNEPATGTGTFSGNCNETFIHITLTDPTDKVNNPIIEPKFVTFNVEENTLGTLGETWIYYLHDNDTTENSKRGIYVGNTGSFTGRFRWYAFYSVSEDKENLLQP